MKNQSHFSDEGIVLAKNQLRDYNQRVTIFSAQHGKLSLGAYGTKKITSKRLSHLETGNVIKFSWREKDGYQTLSETELQYAHSQIKADHAKMDIMYTVFFILNRILPDSEPEETVYRLTLTFLRSLHSELKSQAEVDEFLQSLLIELGFLDPSQIGASFDTIQFIEGLIGGRVRVHST